MTSIEKVIRGLVLIHAMLFATTILALTAFGIGFQSHYHPEDLLGYALVAIPGGLIFLAVVFVGIQRSKRGPVAGGARWLSGFIALGACALLCLHVILEGWSIDRFFFGGAYFATAFTLFFMEPHLRARWPR